MSRTNHSFRFAAILLTAVAGVVAGDRAWACSTPVYRVAMYDWVSAPYHVFHFYRDKVADEDAKIHEAIRAAAKDEQAPANVIVHLVDVAKKEALDELPLVVLKAWRKDSEEKAPLHVVYTAWGAKLWEGRLKAADVPALLDSPKRKQLAEMLDDGNAAVMLVLAAPKEEKTKRAEKLIAKVIADAAAGKIDAGALPEPGVAPNEKKNGEPVLKIGMLTVSRTDPAETWLVRSLVAVEPDLGEYADEAMIFAVYGRARALPPLIGKGINAQNLADAALFVSGACSCTIKDQNPGMDLLVRWNWDKTAEKLAANDPTLQWEGDEFGYQEIEPGPQQIARAEEPADMPEESAATEPPASEPAKVEAKETEPAAQPLAQEFAAETTANESAPNDLPAVDAGAIASEDARDHGETDRYATRQAWRLGIGMGLGAIVLLLAGLVVLRRQ